MTSVEEFLDELKTAQTPVGVGLITLNPFPPGPYQVVTVNDPVFDQPFPIRFDYPLKKIMAVPMEIIDDVVETMRAVPVPGYMLWWSFAIYE